MTWMDWIQGAGSVALVVFGLHQMAMSLKALTEPSISALSERFRHLPGSQILFGILAGAGFQGRGSLDYVRKRRVIGLLSRAQALGLTLGMAIGLYLPVMAIWYLPDSWRFTFLIAGLVLSILSRTTRLRHGASALTGIGLCWVGYASLRSLPDVALPAFSVTIILPVAFLFRMPAVLWLLVAAVSPVFTRYAGGMTAVLGIAGWGLALVRVCSQQSVPFDPPASLLDNREQRFPERALQAVLLEIRRMAQGLARSTDRWLPVCFGFPPENRSSIETVEEGLNEFKTAAQRYLKQLSYRQLDDRQAQILLHLDRCVSDLERMGDHLHRLALHAATAKRPLVLTAAVQDASRRAAAATNTLLATVATAITGRHELAEQSARSVLEQRDRALQATVNAKKAWREAMEAKALAPDTALYCRDSYEHLERLIRHARAIALAELQPAFWINPDAVFQQAAIAHPESPPAVSPTPYLDRLREEEAER